eukprot:scaffold252678_cov31-Tisochrysis_lutea.AAC.1
MQASYSFRRGGEMVAKPCERELLGLVCRCGLCCRNKACANNRSVTITRQERSRGSREWATGHRRAGRLVPIGNVLDAPDGSDTPASPSRAGAGVCNAGGSWSEVRGVSAVAGVTLRAPLLATAAATSVGMAVAGVAARSEDASAAAIGVAGVGSDAVLASGANAACTSNAENGSELFVGRALPEGTPVWAL